MAHLVRKQINPYKITWKPIQNLKSSDITYKTGTTKRKYMTTIRFLNQNYLSYYNAQLYKVKSEREVFSVIK